MASMAIVGFQRKNKTNWQIQTKIIYGNPWQFAIDTIIV
jgi:hypothetical protein